MGIISEEGYCSGRCGSTAKKWPGELFGKLDAPKKKKKKTTVGENPP